MIYNDNATSNPPYSHAIRIALARPGTHKIPPSVTDHNKLARPPDMKKGLRDRALRGGRVVGSKHRRVKPGNNNKLPGQRDSAIWRFLLKESNGFAMWHLLLPRTLRWDYLAIVVSAKRIFRIFAKTNVAAAAFPIKTPL